MNRNLNDFREVRVDLAAGRDQSWEIVLDEVLLIGGRRDRTRNWVVEAGPELSFRNADGTVDLYRLKGKNRRGKPVYEFEGDEEDVEIKQET